MEELFDENIVSTNFINFVKEASSSAGEGSNLSETGRILNYPGQVWEMSYWRKKDSQQMDRILLRAVQPWDLWWQHSTGLHSAPDEDLQPILRVEVESAVASLKKRKSGGVHNIPAELFQAGGDTMIDVLTEVCNRIWRAGTLPPWTQSLIITLPKKGNLQLYRTTELSASSVIRAKLCWKSYWIGLNPKLKRSGFRAGRSTTEQIFSLRIMS